MFLNGHLDLFFFFTDRKGWHTTFTTKILVSIIPTVKNKTIAITNSTFNDYGAISASLWRWECRGETIGLYYQSHHPIKMHYSICVNVCYSTKTFTFQDTLIFKISFQKKYFFWPLILVFENCISVLYTGALSFATLENNSLLPKVH